MRLAGCQRRLAAMDPSRAVPSRHPQRCENLNGFPSRLGREERSMQVAAVLGSHLSVDGAAVTLAAAALILMAAIGLRRMGETASTPG